MLRLSIQLLICWCALCYYPLQAQTITLGSLLDELVDSERLTRLPEHSYRLWHASSYDRRAQQPYTFAWFSNDDWGVTGGSRDGANYIRVETNDFRKEYVFMDKSGPGAIVRFWVTVWDSTPTILRIYLDGATAPVIQGSLTQLSGKNLLAASPLSFVAPPKSGTGVGHNLYLPIPFNQQCKITVENPSARMYYNVDYRLYVTNTLVESFTSNALVRYASHYSNTLFALSNNHPIVTNVSTTHLLQGYCKKDGGTQAIQLAGPCAIRELQFQLRADDLMQALRSTHLEIDFDGETNAVHCPLGDFFGTGGTVVTGRTWFAEFNTNNTMHAFWTMPFQQSATLRIVNHGKQPVYLTSGKIITGPYDWQTNSMHFHAAWREYAFEDSNTSALGWLGEDLNYITLSGRGRLVGDSLSIFNDAKTDIPHGYANWWGEGDEKIYVDGEPFPSHFGTGTEDYYGYAWCLPDVFNTPFIAQPIGFGNSRTGKAINTRMRLLDDLPYESSLLFDMELMPWRVGRHRFAPTVFWYALPGGSCAHPDPLAASQLPVAQTTSGIEYATNTCPIGLRLEFDTMAIAQKSGGTTTIAMTNGWGLSQEKCIFWKSCVAGDSITFEFQAVFSNTCTLAWKMISLPKSGSLSVSMNGVTFTNTLTLTGVSGHPVTILMGNHLLNQGTSQLRFEVTALAPEETSADFAFDYLENQGPYDLSHIWPPPPPGTIILLHL
jgi:Protein of unknown function (DUF2961)